MHTVQYGLDKEICWLLFCWIPVGTLLKDNARDHKTDKL